MSVKLQKGSVVRSFTVPMHLEVIAPCATQSDISSIEPCPFTIVPDGPQSENVNILWVREKKPDILHFFSEEVSSAQSPSCSPAGPLTTEIPAYRAFLHLLLYLSYPNNPQ